jgi:DNA-binding transcriptional regulator YiaG
VTERIKRVRRDLGLSQKEFADLVGVSERSVQHWESGKKPQPKALRRLAEVAKKPVAWFYEAEEAVA